METTRLPEIIAITVVVAFRTIGLQMFDVQLQRWRTARSSRCKRARAKRWRRFRPWSGTRDCIGACTCSPARRPAPPSSSDWLRWRRSTICGRIYLAAANELRAGTIWYSLAGADPFRDYVRRTHAMFQGFTRTIEAEVPTRIARATASRVDPRQRGATWTYLTTDEPFGSLTERAMRGLVRMFRRRGQKSNRE